MKPEDKFYYAFYIAKKLKLYFNEIKELSGLSNASLVNIVKKLGEKGFVSVEKRKGNTFYILSHIYYAYLMFAKFDMMRYDDLNEDVIYSLMGFRGGAPKDIACIVLFGSTSRKEESRGKSDIDIMIVFNKFEDDELQLMYEKYMKNKFEKLKEDKNAFSFFPFSLFYTNIEEFENSDDNLIKEVRETGFPIKGEQRFYEIMCKKWMRE